MIDTLVMYVSAQTSVKVFRIAATATTIGISTAGSVPKTKSRITSAPRPPITASSKTLELPPEPCVEASSSGSCPVTFTVVPAGTHRCPACLPLHVLPVERTDVRGYGKPYLHRVGESLAHALDLRAVHGELARVGAVPLAELAHEHEALQVQDEVVAIALVAATPIAPPICRLVLTRPEATPASARSTPVRLAIVTGTNENPMPAPPRTKAGKRSAGAAGASSAPPSPCTPRKAISEPSDQARPQSSEAALKSARPVTKSRRRPSRSAR